MKSYYQPALFTAMFFSNAIFSQDKVGIGVTLPTEALSIAKGLNIDHNNENTGVSLLNGLKFGNAAVPSQIVGICSNRSSVAPFYTMDFYTNNTRRMIILQNGFVGIGTIPTLYNLEVEGTIRTTSNLRSDFDVLANDDVIANGTIIAGANISAGTNISATNDISAGGDLSANGRGVIMNNGVGRMKYATYTATLSVTNLASEGTVTGAINIPVGTFSGIPTAYVGNVWVENGEYYKALIVLENVSATNVTVRVVNPTPSPITFSNASWKIVVVGPY